MDSVSISTNLNGVLPLDQTSNLSTTTPSFILSPSTQNMSPSAVNVLPTVNLNEMYQQQSGTFFSLSPKSLADNEVNFGQTPKTNVVIPSGVYTAPLFPHQLIPFSSDNSSNVVLHQSLVQPYDAVKLSDTSPSSVALTNLLLPPPPPPPPLPVLSSLCLQFGSKILIIYFWFKFLIYVFIYFFNLI